MQYLLLFRVHIGSTISCSYLSRALFRVHQEHYFVFISRVLLIRFHIESIKSTILCSYQEHYFMFIYQEHYFVFIYIGSTILCSSRTLFRVHIESTVLCSSTAPFRVHREHYLIFISTVLFRVHIEGTI